MRELAVTPGRGDHLGTVVRGQLDGTGEEVGVQMGIHCVCHAQPPLLRGGTHRAEIQARVHHQPPALTEVDQIDGVAQPLIDQRCDVDFHGRLDLHYPTATGRPARLHSGNPSSSRRAW